MDMNMSMLCKLAYGYARASFKDPAAKIVVAAIGISAICLGIYILKKRK